MKKVICIITAIALTTCAEARAQEASELSTNFQGLIILPSLDEVNPNGVAEVPKPGGVKIVGPKFLDYPSVTVIVGPYLGKPLTESVLRSIQTNLVLLCREKGHPVVDVSYPNHQIQNGVVQLAVVEGKLGKLVVENPGRKWYRDEWIQKQMGLKPGDAITQRKLDRGLERLNRNPDFREVDARFEQGANLGEADVTLVVKDRFPLRPHVGVDDETTEIFGGHRVRFGAVYGNLFGLDHVLDYEYATDFSFDRLRSHTPSYIAPLPWGHTLTLLGNYSDLNPDLNKSGFPGFESPGTFYQGSGRYSAPLPSLWHYKHELSVAYDHKFMDSALLFSSTAVGPRTELAIDQFTFGYGGHLKDGLGQTSFGVRGVWSPGGLTDQNTDEAFDLSRAQTRAEYYYIVLEGERVTRLPFGFSHIIDVTWQTTPDRLAYSEQAYIGGFNNVSGYDERLILGDEGLIIRNELRTPVIPLWRLPGNRSMAIQFLAFFDYGSIAINNLQPTDRPSDAAHLESIGGGFRFQVTRNLSVRFDYGFQLHQDAFTRSQPGVSSNHSRGHFAVDLAF